MDGDVLFANSTCFDDSLMSKMSKMAEGLKPGAIFVTFTKGLVTPGKPPNALISGSVCKCVCTWILMLIYPP